MAQYKLFHDLVNICEGAPAVRLSGALFWILSLVVERVSIPSPRLDSWLSIDGSNISHLIGMDQVPAGADLVNSNTFF